MLQTEGEHAETGAQWPPIEVDVGQGYERRGNLFLRAVALQPTGTPMRIARTLSMTALLAVAWAPSAFASGDHQFHSMSVTAPGSRSQGWNGKLHDRARQELPLEAGKHVTTNAGVFVGVPCTLPWVPCGYIHEEQLRWMNTNGGNFILGSGSWEYRLQVTAPCSRSEGWRGELLHQGRPVVTRRKSIKTPFGTFVRKTSAHLWGQRGWFHVSWPSPTMARGNWPCGGD
jgi:hypothetical protein